MLLDFTIDGHSAVIITMLIVIDINTMFFSLSDEPDECSIQVRPADRFSLKATDSKTLVIVSEKLSRSARLMSFLLILAYPLIDFSFCLSLSLAYVVVAFAAHFAIASLNDIENKRHVHQH